MRGELHSRIGGLKTRAQTSHSYYAVQGQHTKYTKGVLTLVTHSKSFQVIRSKSTKVKPKAVEIPFNSVSIHFTKSSPPSETYSSVHSGLLRWPTSLSALSTGYKAASSWTTCTVFSKLLEDPSPVGELIPVANYCGLLLCVNANHSKK